MCSIDSPMRLLILTIGVLVGYVTDVRAEGFDALWVTPKFVIEHDIEVECMLDSASHFISLKGPVWLWAGEDVSLTGYEISSGKRYQASTISFSSDQIEGETTVTVAAPTLYFMGAQVLGTGAPAPVPDNLDRYLAFPVQRDGLDAPTSYVCLPTEQWHHDEHDTLKDPETGYLMTPVERKPRLNQRTTIDPFGLHSLAGRAVKFQVVPIKLTSTSD